MAKVYVGMSGGVDSSVSAALLKEQGHEVTGVFMKNWARDLPGFKCPWREDLADAKRVAVQLGIPFKMYDFQDEYKQKVVDYMIEEYKAGRTPNPDIMCNQEVKFKLFLETALSDGAEMIATGHYARIVRGSESTNHQASNSKHTQIPNDPNSKLNPPFVIPAPARTQSIQLERSESASFSKINNQESNFYLQQAVDSNKDQTYFLYRVTEEALSKTLFPLGEMKKPDVRKKAAELGLITAEKKDSVGICFVGEIGIKEFLQNFVTTEPGNIIEKSSGTVLGKHDGALYYTIGQRHGLNVGGGLPYYVIDKDMDKNEVYVSTDLNDSELWHSSLTIADVHWINAIPSGSDDLYARIRHRGPLMKVSAIKENDDRSIVVQFEDEIRAIAPGQSAVLYQDKTCLGGGMIV